MIEIIEIDLNLGKQEEHEQLNELLNNGFQIIAHTGFQNADRFAWERFTLHKSDTEPKAILSEIVLTTIATIERGETSTNQRPMWRCTTDDSKKVNIFLNTDEKEKDSFHLFEAAGWGEKLQEMALYSTIDQDIQVAIKKAGKFWEVVLVRPYSQPDYPF